LAPRGASEARAALGQRLRDIRADTGLTGRELAALAGWHYTKVSKIEHGTTMPTEADLELWCFHCAAQAELPDLVLAARNVQRMYAELRRLHRGGIAPYQRELLADQVKSHRFRIFAMTAVPGPLQIREYARVRLQEGAEMLGLPGDDIEEAADVRMQRAELLNSGNRLFHFVVCEHVLRSAMAPPDVMRAQLEHLLGAEPLARVQLGILPTRVRRYAPFCSFWITDDRRVEIETFSAIIGVDQPREIAIYARVFDHYARSAVYGTEARKLIAAALDDHPAMS
jgi:transcriptional regulator with XRE-family HTH domain